jgi:hypothetical protein
VNDANKHWLSKDDIASLKAYCLRNNVPWNGHRDRLLEQGQNGNLSDKAFRKYKTLLARIHYEMNRRRRRRAIVIPSSIIGLSPKYYKFK